MLRCISALSKMYLLSLIFKSFEYFLLGDPPIFYVFLDRNLHIFATLVCSVSVRNLNSCSPIQASVSKLWRMALLVVVITLRVKENCRVAIRDLLIGHRIMANLCQSSWFTTKPLSCYVSLIPVLTLLL